MSRERAPPGVPGALLAEEPMHVAAADGLLEGRPRRRRAAVPVDTRAGEE